MRERSERHLLVYIYIYTYQALPPLMGSLGCAEWMQVQDVFEYGFLIFRTSAEVYPGEGELGNALLQIYMGSLDAAVRHWESAAPPSPRVEMVQISIPKAVHTGELAQSRRAAQTEDVAVEIPLQLVQEERKGPGEPMPDMQVPHHILSAMAVSICENRASMEDGGASSAELARAYKKKGDYRKRSRRSWRRVMRLCARGTL